jgi:hypothetical protein
MSVIVGFIHKILVRVREHIAPIELLVQLYTTVERDVHSASSTSKPVWITNEVSENVVCYSSVSRIVRLCNEVQVVAEV